MNDFMRKALYGANHQIIPSIKNGRIYIRNSNLLDLYVKAQINF